jgi:hypothetical protein
MNLQWRVRSPCEEADELIDITCTVSAVLLTKIDDSSDPKRNVGKGEKGCGGTVYRNRETTTKAHWHWQKTRRCDSVHVYAQCKRDGESGASCVEEDAVESVPAN